MSNIIIDLIRALDSSLVSESSSYFHALYNSKVKGVDTTVVKQLNTNKDENEKSHLVSKYLGPFDFSSSSLCHELDKVSEIFVANSVTQTDPDINKCLPISFQISAIEFYSNETIDFIVYKLNNHDTSLCESEKQRQIKNLSDLLQSVYCKYKYICSISTEKKLTDENYEALLTYGTENIGSINKESGNKRTRSGKDYRFRTFENSESDEEMDENDENSDDDSIYKGFQLNLGKKRESANSSNKNSNNEIVRVTKSGGDNNSLVLSDCKSILSSVYLIPKILSCIIEKIPNGICKSFKRWDIPRLMGSALTSQLLLFSGTHRRSKRLQTALSNNLRRSIFEVRSSLILLMESIINFFYHHHTVIGNITLYIHIYIFNCYPYYFLITYRPVFITRE